MLSKRKIRTTKRTVIGYRTGASSFNTKRYYDIMIEKKQDNLINMVNMYIFFITWLALLNNKNLLKYIFFQYISNVCNFLLMYKCNKVFSKGILLSIYLYV